MALQKLLLFLACLTLSISITCSFNILPSNFKDKSRNYGSISGQRWDSFEGMECKILGPVTVLNHLGDYQPFTGEDDLDKMKKHEYNLNVGKAIDALRRDLPICFYTSNLDFSIFANQITVVDGYQNKMAVQKSIYSAAIRSMRVASALSSIYPSMNVKKIEYIEECRTIQCLVDVVLPDSVRIDGQAVWEGMFYFGIDQNGLIDTHIFDRKISNMTPAPLKVSTYPWVKSSVSWTPDLLKGRVLASQTSFVSKENINENIETDSLISN